MNVVRHPESGVTRLPLAAMEVVQLLCLSFAGVYEYELLSLCGESGSRPGEGNVVVPSLSTYVNLKRPSPAATRVRTLTLRRRVCDSLRTNNLIAEQPLWRGDSIP